MITLTLSTAFFLIGLMIISLYFQSAMLSLITGLFVIYEALLHTQTDKGFCLLLIGLGLIMIGQTIVFSGFNLKYKTI